MPFIRYNPRSGFFIPPDRADVPTLQTTDTRFFDGTKSISLSQLPPEAWTILGGEADAQNVQYYAAVPFLYRGIEIRANTLAGLPFTLNRGETVIWSHDADDVPSDMPWLAYLPELLWQTEAALCLGAQAYWYKERARRGKLLDVRWWTPSTVKPQWSQTAGLTGFERTLGTTRTLFPIEDVVYLRLRGQHETKPRKAPAEAAAAAAGVIYNADKFAASFFERGAIKATLLQVAQSTSKDERDRVKAWWQRVAEGAKNAWSSHVVATEAMSAVTIGEGLESLSNGELTREKREDIATALGVPHSLLMSNAANYATSQQDEINFYNTTILPGARIIERAHHRAPDEPATI